MTVRWRGRARRAAPLLAILAVLAVLAVLVVPDARDDLPLAPRSSAPDGTRALVEILRALGREVDIVTPDEPGDAPVVLLLVDQLTDDGRAALERRVEQGARLVVTDPDSALAPAVAGGALLFASGEPDCDAPALARVGRVRSLGALFEVPDGATGCFTGDAGAWLVVQPRGAGEIVATGGPGFLQNGAIGSADHAVLAVHLLAPGAQGRVEVVAPVLRAAGGEDGQVALGDLVPPGLRAALWQVLIGFLVLVVWRARRLGKPLVDRAPVRLASADLTAAVGALLDRHDARADALRRVAADTRRHLARRLDLPDAGDLDVLCAAIAVRTARDTGALARTLDPPPPGDDAALLAAIAALDDVTQAVEAALATTLEESDVH